VNAASGISKPATLDTRRCFKGSDVS